MARSAHTLRTQVALCTPGYIATHGPMTDRVMVDIETLGKEPGACIVSIGAVRFDRGGLLDDEFHVNVSAQSCQGVGLEIDAGTMEWWLGRPDEVKRVLSGGMDVASALDGFADFYGGADEIWANSPAFDCAILAAAYAAVSRDTPWDFWQTRDVRTVKNLSVPTPDPDRDGPEHDALADAKHQARVVAGVLDALEGR